MAEAVIYDLFTTDSGITVTLQYSLLRVCKNMGTLTSLKREATTSLAPLLAGCTICAILYVPLAILNVV